jgi:hypothetical protein
MGTTIMGTGASGKPKKKKKKKKKKVPELIWPGK